MWTNPRTSEGVILGVPFGGFKFYFPHPILLQDTFYHLTCCLADKKIFPKETSGAENSVYRVHPYPPDRDPSDSMIVIPNLKNKVALWISWNSMRYLYVRAQ